MVRKGILPNFFSLYLINNNRKRIHNNFKIIDSLSFDLLSQLISGTYKYYEYTHFKSRP